ncbi:UNVERIFIED_CONTAM: hypothetical protein FKN15_055134 [Acipenser sinensis]
MGNAGSMDSQQTDFRAHSMPLKLPMPEPGELEERFAIVLHTLGISGNPVSWSVFHIEEDGHKPSAVKSLIDRGQANITVQQFLGTGSSYLLAIFGSYNRNHKVTTNTITKIILTYPLESFLISEILEIVEVVPCIYSGAVVSYPEQQDDVFHNPFAVDFSCLKTEGQLQKSYSYLNKYKPYLVKNKKKGETLQVSGPFR